MASTTKLTIRQYRATFAAGSAPARNTVISRIRRRQIAGVYEGGWYVIVDAATGCAVTPPPAPAAPVEHQAAAVIAALR